MSSDLTKEAVEAKLAKNPSGASNLLTLEKFVAVQVTNAVDGNKVDALSKTYSLLANRTLLKIYQYQPQKSDPCMGATVLLLSLIASFATTATDALSLVYLLPERIVRAEPCSTVLKCCRLMDSCQFVEFWKVFRTITPDMFGDGNVPSGDSLAIFMMLAQSDGATLLLRRAILQVIALTSKSAPTGKVLAALDLGSVDELQKLNFPCVASVSSDVVVFVATGDNTKRERVFQEGLSYGDISEMMSKVVTAE
jgi:hypothetical protein